MNAGVKAVEECGEICEADIWKTYKVELNGLDNVFLAVRNLLEFSCESRENIFGSSVPVQH